MSKSVKKKSHWTNRVHEVVLSRGPSGKLGFELEGGAENGQFPVIGEVKLDRVKLNRDELLLEVNDTPVAGLTIRDVWAVIRHCRDPVRLKCVKQGEFKLDFRDVLNKTVYSLFIYLLKVIGDIKTTSVEQFRALSVSC